MYAAIFRWLAALIVTFSGRSSTSKSYKNVYTPSTYPLPTSSSCAFEYLKLSYICDPSHWLSHTEASKINKSLNYDKFSSCPSTFSSSSASVNGMTTVKSKLTQASNSYTLGLALANVMKENETLDCRNVFSNVPITTDDGRSSRNNIFEEIPNKIAQILRDRWSDEDGNDCEYDVLIFVVENLEYCLDEKISVVTDRPVVGIAYSKRVKELLTSSKLQSGFHLLKSTDNSLLLIILKTFSHLETTLPDPINSTQNNFGQNRKFQSAVIPTWALVVFLVCLSLTLICTALGHWVNTGDSRGRFHSPDTFLFARGHSNDRRWRAGFAGGMMELHAAQPNTSATSRQSNASSVRSVGNARAKGKMFGAMAMGNKKASNAQCTYQRV